MFLFVKAKKRVLSLTMAFMLCIGFCPSIRSNEIASYTSQVIQHLVSPTNVAALLMGLFMMAAMLYTFKKSDLHDHSVGFAPVKKNDILVDRSSYVGKIPEDIDTMLIHIQSGDFKKNRIQDDKPVVGILLYAPSGAGKTFLSQLIAKEANCPVFMVSLSNFQQGQIVGSGSKSVMNLFEKAKEQALKWNSKTAIICIDELHNFQQGGSSGYRDPSKEVTDALLTEMDGQFTSEKYKDVTIIVIGTTNQLSALDDALSSRFSKKIELSLPSFMDIHTVVTKKLSSIPEMTGAMMNIAASLIAGQEQKSFRGIDSLCKDLRACLTNTSQSELNTLNTLGKLLLFGLHRSALTNYTLKSLASTLLERDKAAPIYNKLQIPENIEITEIEQEKLQRALNFGYKYRPLKRLRECRSEAITEALQYCGHLCSLPEDRITSLKTQLIPSIEDNNIDIGKVPKIYNFIDIVKLIEQPVTQ